MKMNIENTVKTYNTYKALPKEVKARILPTLLVIWITSLMLLIGIGVSIYQINLDSSKPNEVFLKDGSVNLGELYRRGITPAQLNEVLNGK